MKCVECDDKQCYFGRNCTSIKERSEELYEGDDLMSMRVSTSIESKYYMKATRLEELILYAKGMGFTKLGLAFCWGLADEARTISRILSRDFEVISTCCKLAGIDKSKLDLERLHPEREIEAICNPIGQAIIFNEAETDLNIILGLCIGHDTLFTKHSKAPVTTLAVKDRVLTHNPLGAIYSAYYLEGRFGLRAAQTEE